MRNILIALCLIACVGLACANAPTKTEVVEYLCGKPEPFAGITAASHCAKAAEMMADIVDKDSATCPAHFADAFGAVLGYKKREVKDMTQEEKNLQIFEDMLAYYVHSSRNTLPGYPLPSFQTGYYAPSLQQSLLALVQLWLVGFGGPYGSVVNGWGLSALPYVMNAMFVPSNAFYQANNWAPPPALPGSGTVSLKPVTDSLAGQLMINNFQNAINAWTAVAEIQSQHAGTGLNNAAAAANSVDSMLSGRLEMLQDMTGTNGVEKQTDSFNSWITNSLMTICACVCDSEAQA